MDSGYQNYDEDKLKEIQSNLQVSFNVKTDIVDGHIIEQTIDQIMDGIVNTTVKELIDTRDKQTRDALIALGWTPPSAIILPFK